MGHCGLLELPAHHPAGTCGMKLLLLAPLCALWPPRAELRAVQHALQARRALVLLVQLRPAQPGACCAALSSLPALIRAVMLVTALQRLLSCPAPASEAACVRRGLHTRSAGRVPTLLRRCPPARAPLQNIVYTQTTLESEPTVLIDPNKLSEDGTVRRGRAGRAGPVKRPGGSGRRRMNGGVAAAAPGPLAHSYLQLRVPGPLRTSYLPSHRCR